MAAIPADNLKKLPAPDLIAALKPISARSETDAAAVKQAVERYVADERERARVLAAL